MKYINGDFNKIAFCEQCGNETLIEIQTNDTVDLSEIGYALKHVETLSIIAPKVNGLKYLLSSLKSLTLIGCWEEDLQDVILNNESIKTLSIQNTELKALTVGNHVERLDLSNNKLVSFIIPDSAIYVNLSLNSIRLINVQQTAKLQELNLSSNSLGNKGFESILRVVNTGLQLKSLDVTQNGISDLLPLSDTLRSTNVLRSISLSNNRINWQTDLLDDTNSWESIKKHPFIKAICINNIFSHLNISNTCLENPFLFAYDIGLDELVIGNNPLDPKLLEHCVSKYMTLKLKSLVMSSICEITGPLVDIEQNKTLKTLSLSGNRISNLHSLFDGLSRNESVEILNILGVSITDSLGLSLQQMLYNSQSIKIVLATLDDISDKSLRNCIKDSLRK